MRKTKLVLFGKPDKAGKFIPGTFDFLGFTFYWAKSLRGFWVIKKKTARKRLMRFMKTLWDRCMRNRHNPLKEQHKALCEKLRGYYQYFGVRSNYRALETVRNHAVRAWRFRLSRRSHKGGLSWEKYEKIISDFPSPLPRIIHNI